ncbi:MAG: glucose 1-dehydrogenase [Alphaproteobacteria bacterium]|nr:glucose 1-dehydrogenase [Alphaproteobacteria bacterium]
MGRVEGKIALVTGGARGLGAAIAERLIEEGARVMLTDINEAEGRETAARLAGNTGAASFLAHDVADEAAWPRIVRATEEALGPLDILVNNAGVYMGKSMDEMSLAEWRRLMAINVDGVFLGTRAGSLVMRDRPKNKPMASIVNLSSVAGIKGSAYNTAYCASKGAVRIFTKAAAQEFAFFKWPIRVNSVHPAIMETDMAGGIYDLLLRVGAVETREQARQASLERHPIGRLGTARDVADAVLFLASDESAFMTGSELVLDGGFTS